MKKSLLALAVLGAFAGVASAQSSVTLFGTVDLSAKYVKNDAAQRRVSLAQDGINSSQLGFRGVEDLGGGLKASFVLIAGVNADTGTTSSESAGKFFNRKSTLGLSGGFGEVRLGRDYAPSFWNLTIFDAFGTNGVGSSINITQKYTGTRRDNSIGYFLPSNIGGVYGQFMVAAAEGGTTLDRAGRYIGGRVGFAAGPFDVAGSYSQQRFVSGAADEKSYNIGGSYDLGVVKLMGYFNRETQASDKDNMFSFSIVAPVGQGEIHAGYEQDKRTNGAAASTKIDQFAVGYVYSLSKRTAVYTTASRVNNKNGTRNAIGGGNAYGTDGVVGTSPKSTGIEFGVRHFF